MQINWKLKSIAFAVIDRFSLFPILYFIQKNITKRSIVEIKNVDENWLLHRDNISSLDQPTLIEFGAGKNLRQNLFLSKYCNKQFVVDLFPMLDISQVNEVAEQLSENLPDFAYKHCETLADIKNAYSIEYIAPFDMTNAPMESDCIDCCVSTNTMEHIQKDDLIKILEELKRIIKDGGLISAKIDYSDHYAHTDRNIGLLNFLLFSESDWKQYNHKSHYLNRLRHYDYRKIFDELGFVVEVDKPIFTVNKPLTISEDFEESNPTVHATAGIFLLRVVK